VTADSVPDHAFACGCFLGRLGYPNGTARSRWLDSLRADGGSTACLPIWGAGYEPPRSYTIADFSAFVRIVTIPGLVRQTPRQIGTGWCELAWRKAPDYQVDVLAAGCAASKGSDHVLADYLLSRGHWMGEPLALWVHRVSRSSRALHHRSASEAFVMAVPLEAPPKRE